MNDKDLAELDTHLGTLGTAHMKGFLGLDDGVAYNIYGKDAEMSQMKALRGSKFFELRYYNDAGVMKRLRELEAAYTLGYEAREERRNQGIKDKTAALLKNLVEGETYAVILTCDDDSEWPRINWKSATVITKNNERAILEVEDGQIYSIHNENMGDYFLLVKGIDEELPNGY